MVFCFLNTRSTPKLLCRGREELCGAGMAVPCQQQGKEGVKGLQTCAQGSGVPLEEVEEHTMNCGALPGLVFVLLSCKGIVLWNFAANCSSIWGLRVVTVLFLSKGFWRRSGEVQIFEPEVCTGEINRNFNKALNSRIPL